MEHESFQRNFENGSVTWQFRLLPTILCLVNAIHLAKSNLIVKGEKPIAQQYESQPAL